MYCLVRLPVVASGSLASAQKGQERAAQVERHQIRDPKPAVTHGKPAVQRVLRVLLAVAREVEDGHVRQRLQDVRRARTADDRYRVIWRDRGIFRRRALNY